MPRLVVVLPLVPLRVGESFPLRTWPLHVTVAPTFITDTDTPAVTAAIAPVISQTRAMSVTAGGDEGFGPSGRVPVTVLVPSPEVSALHLLLLNALTAVGAVFDDPQYTGRTFCPHVTVTRTARLQQGDVTLLEQAALVDMEPVGPQRVRRVLWVSRLRLAGRPPRG